MPLAPFPMVFDLSIIKQSIFLLFKEYAIEQPLTPDPIIAIGSNSFDKLLWLNEILIVF